MMASQLGSGFDGVKGNGEESKVMVKSTAACGHACESDESISISRNGDLVMMNIYVFERISNVTVT